MENTITFGQQIPMTSSVATERKIEKQVTPKMQAQERAWALAAQKGDSAAFMHIVEAYQRPVYNLCYRMLGDAAEAEDAAQETFLRAYTKLNTYQQTANSHPGCCRLPHITASTGCGGGVTNWSRGMTCRPGAGCQPPTRNRKKQP